MSVARLVLLALAAHLFLGGCKTTNSNAKGYNHGTAHQSGVSDGPMNPQGPVNRVRNAFSSFMY